MMVINGEKVWVPSQRRDLIAGLKRLGVSRVNGRSLRNASKDELRRVYCRERARVVRERQRRRHHRKPVRSYNQSFAAWSATD